MLFPAHISDDSPWKQETATSRLDPEMENKTQEAIDLYFSQHHKVTSPDNGGGGPAGAAEATNVNERSTSVVAMDESELGGSPDLSKPRLSRSYSTGQGSSPKAKRAASVEASNNVTLASLQSSDSNDQPPVPSKCSRWSQTVMSLPPLLPTEVEEVLAKFYTFTQSQDNCSPVLAGNCLPSSTAAGAANKQQNMKSFSRIPFLSAAAAAASAEGGNDNSNSSLRRKLFEGDNMEEEEEGSDPDEPSSPTPGPMMTPGAVMLTPKGPGSGQQAPFSSPGLTWSVSPVTRKTKKQSQPQTPAPAPDPVGPPKESSTPTKN